MIKTKYCVYKHQAPNKKVYIGITCQQPEKRWANGKAYKENKHFNNAINKWGWNNFSHEIIANNLTKEEAENAEIYFINKVYKSNKREFGYNIEYGGYHNGKTSQETKEKISKANKGKHNSPKTEFKKGHKTIINKEAKQKLSRERKGKHASVKTEFKKGHKPLNNKKVICVETGKTYNSGVDAYKDTKIMNSHIAEVCKGKRKTAGKMHWKYVKS